MIQDNQKDFSRLQMLMDAGIIAVAYIVAWTIRFIGPFSYSAVRALTFQQYMFALIFIIPGYLASLSGIYSLRAAEYAGASSCAGKHHQGKCTWSFTCSIQSVYDGRIRFFPTDRDIYFCVINILMEWSVRLLISYIGKDMRRRGRHQKQMILVGYSRAAEEYIDRIQQNPQWGYVVRGILDDNVAAGTVYNGIKVIGRIANLTVILPANRLDEIAITLGLSEYYTSGRDCCYV